MSEDLYNYDYTPPNIYDEENEHLGDKSLDSSRNEIDEHLENVDLENPTPQKLPPPPYVEPHDNFNEQPNPYAHEYDNPSNTMDNNSNVRQLPPPPPVSQPISMPDDEENYYVKEEDKGEKTDCRDRRCCFCCGKVGDQPFPILNKNYFMDIRMHRFWLLLNLFEFIILFLVNLVHALGLWFVLIGSLVYPNLGESVNYVLVKLFWVHFCWLWNMFVLYLLKTKPLFNVLTGKSERHKLLMILYIIGCIVFGLYYMYSWLGGTGIGQLTFWWWLIYYIIHPSEGYTLFVSLYAFCVSFGFFVLFIFDVIMFVKAIIYTRNLSPKESINNNDNNTV